MKLLIALSILFLSGCKTGETIAGGASGKVDYCVTFMSTNLFCVNAERALGETAVDSSGVAKEVPDGAVSE
jgi:hypothetical protein